MEYFANNAQSTLTGNVTTTASSLVVLDAASFPADGDFRILVDTELMQVTSITGTTTFNVTRGTENTTKAAHNTGATVTAVLTAAALTDALTTPFGASGSGHAPGCVPDPGSTAGTTRYLREDATWDVPPSGSVTSVALTMPTEFSVSGSPITSTGTLAVSLANQSANQVWAGPASGSAAAPTFRDLVTADLPSSGVTAGSYGSASAVPVVTVNAEGQVTAATTTNIAIAASQVTSGQLAIAQGGTAKSSVTTAPAASSWAGWDASLNLSANATITGYASTATAASTTTLTVASAQQQYFTGSTTQTVKLPVASTLVEGQQFTVVNLSTGIVTVESSGGNTVQAQAANTQGTYTCILNSGTSAASWSVEYSTMSPSSGTVSSVATGTGLTGGPITGAGTIALAATAVTAGSYGSASQVPEVTVNAEGQLTAAANTSIAIAASQVTSGMSNGQLIIGSTSAAPVITTLTAGSGVTITNTAGAITIASSAAATVLRGYLDGFQTANNGSSSQSISVGAGQCADSTNAVYVSLTSTYYKTLGSAWAAGAGSSGTPKGGLDTGSVAASTWYNVFVIATTGGTVDVIFSKASPSTGPALPSGYTYFRRVASVFTSASSTVTPYTQTGDRFLWTTPPNDIDVSNLGNTAVLYTLTVPPGWPVTAVLTGSAANAASSDYCLVSISNPTQNNLATSGLAWNVGSGDTGSPGVSYNNPVAQLSVVTNSSAQIMASAYSASTHLATSTQGFIDPRGRDGVG